MREEIRVPPAWEGKLVLRRWYVPDRSVVAVGDAVCEIETEDANVDLPARVTGRIEHVAPAGAQLRARDVIGRFDSNPST